MLLAAAPLRQAAPQRSRVGKNSPPRSNPSLHPTRMQPSSPAVSVRATAAPVTTETTPSVASVAYSELTVGVPRENFPGERRVAVTPAGVESLLKAGFKAVYVESGAGKEAQFSDDEYRKAGATVGSVRDAMTADIVCKIRPPTEDSLPMMKDGATVISYIYPSRNESVRILSLSEQSQQWRGISGNPSLLAHACSWSSASPPRT